MRRADGLARRPDRLAALTDLWRFDKCQVWITLTGHSMAPTVPAGSRLRLACGRRAFAPGEVLAYRRQGVLLVHRLRRVISDSGGRPLLLCRGDANPGDDPPCAPDAVLGVVVEVRPPTLATRARLGARRITARLRRCLGRGRRILDHVLRGRRPAAE